MKVGLVGTGPWASMAHGPGLVQAEGVELVGVWGRRPGETARLAAALDTAAYDDYAVMLGDVDAVAFAVPPDIQADMACEAASVGRHLLLDKPIATDAAAAQALADTAKDNGVASVVFFTDRFVDVSRAWFDQVQQAGGWLGGWMRWLSALDEPGNPFGASPWRQERGALWDTGPHALSTLSAALGPIDSLVAVAGAGDLVTLTLRHLAGTTSTATLSQFVPPAAVCFEGAVWGREGFSVMPSRPENSHVDAMRVAAQELAAAVRSGQPHEVDVAFGARVVELLADAQAQVDGQRTEGAAR
jgi:predicted dehydrogenase